MVESIILLWHFCYLPSIADIEPVEIDEVILLVSSTLLSYLLLDKLEALLSCVETPAVELPESAMVALCY